MDPHSQPVSPDDAVRTAAAHAGAGRIAAAEAVLGQLLSERPDHCEALALSGLLDAYAGRYEIALRKLTAVLPAKAAEPVFLFNLGGILQALERYSEAIARYREAIALRPQFTEAYCNLGNVYEVLRDHASAIACYKTALTNNPGFAPACFNLGKVLETQGDSEQAEIMYRRAIAADPRLAQAYNNLGNLLLTRGDTAAATDCYRTASELQPYLAEAWTNLARAALASGNTDAAIAACRRALDVAPMLPAAHDMLGQAFAARNETTAAIVEYKRAIALQPDFAESMLNLGNLFDRAGDAEEAVAWFRSAVSARPSYAAAHNNLGVALAARGELDAAIDCYRRANDADPDYAPAYVNLGAALCDIAALDPSLAALQTALRLDSGSADAWNNLGRTHARLRNFVEAINCFRKALEFKPDMVLALSNLGDVLRERGRLEEAAAYCRRAIELDRGLAEAHSNLGNVLRDQGRLAEAIQAYRAALALKPDSPATFSNLLFAMQYDPGSDPSAVYGEHCAYSERFEVPLQRHRVLLANTPDRARPLSIGYVSADFRRHSVAYFFEPLLAHHDRSQFEVNCYYSNASFDDTTRRLAGQSERFVHCAGMSDAELAERIRADGIDILVDLAGHTAGNRLLTFARKPAPIQLAWLGYPGSTGLAAMDYRITDRWAEPPGLAEQFNSETLWHLDRLFCAYRPCAAYPERRESVDLAVRPSPAAARGFITFGSVNNLAKIGEGVIDLWAAILRSVPDSRLLLEAPGFETGSMREHFETRFAARGIASNRLRLIERTPAQQYVIYHDIDIALDPFPANGGTTTCDALWMGVPVVALAGRTFVSRMGVAMLTGAGHPEWIGATPEDYARIARNLAADVAGLSAIRLRLREEVERSAMMDETGFARAMEQAYRSMWEAWCESAIT